MKTLYFHYGMPKSASTTIQQIVTENQERITNSGILIPSLGKPLGVCHHRRMADELNSQREKYLPRIARLFKRTESDVLITSECFYNQSHTLANDVIRVAKKAGFQVHAIVVLRDQASHAASSYSEILNNHKMCRTREGYFQDCLHAERYQYKKFVWDFLYGRVDKVSLTSLALLTRRGVTQWLSECLGVELAESSVAPQRQRMSRESGFILEMICRFRRDGARRLLVSEFLNECERQLGWDTPFHPISETLYHQIYDAYAQENQELMSMVGGQLDEWFPYDPKPISVFDPGNATAAERKGVLEALHHVSELVKKMDENPKTKVNRTAP
jgi:hypothetical protein